MAEDGEKHTKKAKWNDQYRLRFTEGAYELLGDSAPIFQLPGGGVMTEGKLAGRVPLQKSSLITFNFVKLHITGIPCLYYSTVCTHFCIKVLSIHKVHLYIETTSTYRPPLHQDHLYVVTTHSYNTGL